MEFNVMNGNERKFTVSGKFVLNHLVSGVRIPAKCTSDNPNFSSTRRTYDEHTHENKGK